MNQQKIAFRFVIGIALISIVLVVAILLLPRQTDEERQAIVSARRAQLVQTFADQRAREHKADAERDRRYGQNMADELIQAIVYVQDPRTTPPTCFAILTGPAVSTVTCSTIPSGMLFIGK